jgi:predicted DNA-binding transcriptional regulator YafY
MRASRLLSLLLLLQNRGRMTAPELAAELDVCRPPGFSLAEFWRRRSSKLREMLRQGSATVRLSARGRELVPMLLGTAQARAVAETQGRPDARGWVTATVPIESTGHACASWLRLGAEAEVLTPAELREMMAATARALAARYGC